MCGWCSKDHGLGAAAAMRGIVDDVLARTGLSDFRTAWRASFPAG